MRDLESGQFIWREGVGIRGPNGEAKMACVWYQRGCSTTNPQLCGKLECDG